MPKHHSDIVICFLIVITVGVVFLLNKLAATSELFQNPSPDYSWISHGVLNILGYATVLLPGYIVYAYVRKINYLDKTGNGCLISLVRKCFQEELVDRNAPLALNLQQPRTAFEDTTLLLWYFLGLQVSFLSWGVLQEKVMTQQYINSNGDAEHFKDSQFLVFVNRILAFCISGVVILCTKQQRHKCPLYKYVFCSFSNIMSSWCQYEALKYVSFLHQVLAKAAKTIPVMIMGKLISRTKYEYYEYFTAIILSVGMLFFMLDTDTERSGTTVTTFSGVILLCSYIAFDSFTSNWQGALFKQYSMSPIQMMCTVNLFSCIFTAISLLQQGSLITCFKFMLEYPSFMVDCCLLSICSAMGQLFIFKTLATFGPVVFAIITTIRQGLSVLLSCVIYHHTVHVVGMMGIILVFISIFLRIYCGYRMKTIRKRTLTINKL